MHPPQVIVLVLNGSAKLQEVSLRKLVNALRAPPLLKSKTNQTNQNTFSPDNIRRTIFAPNWLRANVPSRIFVFFFLLCFLIFFAIYSLLYTPNEFEIVAKGLPDPFQIRALVSHHLLLRH